MKYDNIKLETNKKIGIITLDRPKALNALSEELIKDLVHALDYLENNQKINVVILRGSEKAFAAGADIKDMSKKKIIDLIDNDFMKPWERISSFRKPIIAAVAGYALGGGCEIAMMCDIILAADNAKFSQPEINLGTIPAGGGTQRLPRFIGKSKAMDLVLSGRMINAEEAEKAGLVSRILPVQNFFQEVFLIAEEISKKSLPVLMLAKESVNRAYENNLAEGILFERRLFQTTFALQDREEGMAAFIDKRRPNFKNK